MEVYPRPGSMTPPQPDSACGGKGAYCAERPRDPHKLLSSCRSPSSYAFSTQREICGLGTTNVTDAGLEHLKGLTGLQELNLSWTKVTDAGESRVKEALPNVWIQR